MNLPGIHEPGSLTLDGLECERRVITAKRSALSLQ